MLEIFAWPFDTDGVPPRWLCGELWELHPELGWLHIAADLATFVAYMCVPLVTLYFLRLNPQARLKRPLLVFLTLVFFSCGLVHLLEAGIFWWPAYRLSSLLKLATAAVSCTGVVVLWRSLPMLLSLKSPAEMNAVVRDREQAEESLRQERYLFNKLMELMPESIYFKDADSRFTRVSKALANRLGLDNPAQVVGKSDRDFFSGEFADETSRDEHVLVDSKQTLRDKTELVRWPDGSESWHLTTKIPLSDSAGKLIGSIGISHDISKLKQIEAELRTSEARFREIVEHAPEAIVLYDADRNCFIDCNPNAEALFELPRAELLKSNPIALSPPTQADGRPTAEIARNVVKLALHGQTQVFEWLHRTAKGREVPCEVRLCALPWAGRRVVRASVTDISIRKATEQAISEARDAAERANRVKSEFLNGMSHELRTPLHQIILATEMGLDHNPTPQMHDFLETIRQSGELLNLLISDILDFANIDADRIKLAQAPLRVQETLDFTLQTLALFAHQKGLALTGHVHDEVPEDLLGDVLRLRQVFMNLIGNAIKFTDRGEVTVEVRLASQSDEQVEIHAVISDTGSGIPPEKQMEIFEAFSKADGTNTKPHSGIGLGLTTTRFLVQKMSGRIWVESELGRGSRFHFTACFSRQKPGSKPAAGRTAADLAGMKVVVVDDNPIQRRFLAEILKTWKMEPLVFDSSEQVVPALEKMHEQGRQPGLVISDFQMPVMDGLVLAEKIHAADGLRDLPILLLTSTEQAFDADRPERANLAAEMIKPVGKSRLFNCIMDLLTKAAAAQQPPVDEPKPAPPPIKNLRVLVVEDSPVSQKLAAALLAKQGHTATIANDGQEALDLLEKSAFDLVLMDVSMPVMGGLECTQQIRLREAGTGRHLLIIAMTAQAMPGDRETCLDVGMDEYLSKPVTPKQLAEKIEYVLRHIGLHAAAPLTAAKQPAVAKPPAVATPPVAPPSLADVPSLLAGALKSVGNNKDLLKTIVEMMLVEAPEALRQMQATLAAGDGTGLSFQTHKLLGSLRIFALPQLSAIVAEIEAAAKRSDLPAAESALTRLTPDLDTLLATMRKWLNG